MLVKNEPIQKILVTGANGFVGQHVLNELQTYCLNRPIEIVASIKPGSKITYTGGTLVELDIRNSKSVRTWISEHQPKAVIHLAAISAPRLAKDNPDSAWSINFGAVRAIGETMLRHSPSSKLIFAGSSEAYGSSFAAAGGKALSEEAPLKPLTVYGATKAAADIALGQLSNEGLNCVRFRPFNHTGPGQLEKFVCAAFAKQIAEIEAGFRDPVLKVGNLESIRDFIDVRDVSAAYVSAIDAPQLAPDANALNISSQQGVSIQKILDALISLSDIEVTVDRDATLARAGEVSATIGANEKIMNTLSWTQRYNLRSTLSDLLDDWRQKIRP